MDVITLDELLKKTEIHPEKLNGRISDDDLREIALFKTLTNWRTVATYLGLDKNGLDAIKREEDDDQMRKLNALEKWKGKFGSKATYVLLKLEKADAAEDVCHLLKGIFVYVFVYVIRNDHKNQCFCQESRLTMPYIYIVLFPAFVHMQGGKIVESMSYPDFVPSLWLTNW